LNDDDPVGHEVRTARERALQAALSSLVDDKSAIAGAIRQEFTAQLSSDDDDGGVRGNIRVAHHDTRRDALAAARQAVLDLRTRDEIGDDAFHEIEEELDWLEMAGGTRE
jgi:CPA1 family monovalent cation:H+ antiporter